MTTTETMTATRGIARTLEGVDIDTLIALIDGVTNETNDPNRDALFAFIATPDSPEAYRDLLMLSSALKAYRVVADEVFDAAIEISGVIALLCSVTGPLHNISVDAYSWARKGAK